MSNNIGSRLAKHQRLWQAALENGALSGVMTELQGGKFGHGFASAFVSKFVGELKIKEYIKGGSIGDKIARTMITGLIGGTVSAATGGKFANGFRQSATHWAFNAESGASKKEIAKSRQVWREQLRCKGLCHGYDGTTKREVGFSFLEDTGIPYSMGVYSGGSAISSAGGVNGGINSQFFSDGSSDSFLVAGVGWGFDLGGSAEANFALYFGDGDGGATSWLGRFDSIHASAWGGTVNFYWGGGWYGVSLGASSDGIGVSKQINEYTSLSGNKPQ